MASVINARDVLLQAAATRLNVDNVIVMANKPGIVKEVQTILAEQPGIDALLPAAAPLRVSYDNAVKALTDYLNGLAPAWNLLTADTPYDGPTFRAKFLDVYAARQALLNSVNTPGLSNAVVYAYKRAAAVPTDNPGNVTYDFTTGKITTPAADALANGYTKSIPAGTDPLYVVAAPASASAGTVQIQAAQWSAPVVLAKDGVAGLNSATVMIYQRAASAVAPALPTANCTYTFATGGLTGLNGGWSRSIPATGGAYLYATTAAAASTGATDDIAPAEWAAANLLAQNGTNGTSGSSGADGQRGTVNIAKGGFSSWSSAGANTAISEAGYGVPQNRDVVTLFGTGYAETRFYNNGSWLVLTAYINGNLLVAGTLSANAVSGGTLSGIVIQLGTGHTVSGKAFEVTAAGTVWTDNIFGGTGDFNNNYSSSSALTATTYQNTEAVVGLVTSSNTNSGAHGVRGKNARNGASGLVGAANGYDFYADGSGVNYGPFTGTHDALITNGVQIEEGDIVYDQACVARRGYSNTIFEVKQTDSATRAGAIGVLVRVLGPLRDFQPAAFIESTYEGVDPSYKLTMNRVMSAEYEACQDSFQLAAINGVGEGQINVCGEGGDVAAGDFIVPSSVPGKGMRLAMDEAPCFSTWSRVVARAREGVNFSSPSEVKTVACIYLCG